MKSETYSKKIYALSSSKFIETLHLWLFRAPNLALEPDLVGVAVRVNAAAAVDDGDVWAPGGKSIKIGLPGKMILF